MKNYSNTEHVGTLDLGGNECLGLVLADDSENLLHGKPGRIARVFGRLLFCIDYEIPGDDTSLPVWVPMVQEKTAHIHEQTELSTSWIIQHNFNSARVLVQVWDNTNKLIGVDEISTLDNNSCEVKLTVPATGHAIVLSGSFEGTAKPAVRFEQDFTGSTVIDVPHGLGYEPTVRVINLEGFELVPDSIQHVSVNEVKITLLAVSSGKVICL